MSMMYPLYFDTVIFIALVVFLLCIPCNYCDMTIDNVLCQIIDWCKIQGRLCHKLNGCPWICVPGVTNYYFSTQN